MRYLPDLPRWTRWAMPAAIVAATAGLLAGSMIPSATAAPRLPARSPGQLLAEVAGKAQMTPLTGTITETASLGLPSLPTDEMLGAPTSLASLLAGSHAVRLWYSDPSHYRLSLPQPMSEEDLVRNGSSAWLWDSYANTATRITMPAAAPTPAVPLVPMMPQQAAGQVLASVGPSTTVRVDANVTVAGQAAYQLVLAPKSPGSLIGQVRIAVGSRHRMPPRVQVFAKGSTSPALEIGFTAISFARPPAADYTFTPPAGAAVAQDHIGPGDLARAGRLSQGMMTAVRAVGVRAVGTGWLTVMDLPESSLAALMSAVPGGPDGPGLPFRSSSFSAAPGSAGSRKPAAMGGPSPDGQVSPLFEAVLNSARPVRGSWGSGSLLRTSLVSILITSGGRVLIGAVTPSVLYRAASQAGHALPGLLRHSASRAGQK